jgi:photosystem II stability/assembly factor-like uncharacterized protein
VTYNANFMTTLTATAAAPFGIGAAKHVVSIGLCYIDRTTLRIIACKAAEAAVQGVIAYSDDLGATWTTVNVGGVVAHGAIKQGSLFVMDYRHIWLTSALGFIYFSNNGGQTWTAQEGGVITVTAWNAVHFADKEFGMAVGVGDEIALTNDGGVTWYAPATTTGSAGDLTACVRFDRNRMLIGDTVGNLYLSEDAGATWAALVWPGAAGGAIDDIKFINEYEGLVSQFSGAADGVIWQTINGGFDWVTVYTSAEELYGLAYVNTRLAYAVGEDGAGTATAVKLTSGSMTP